MINCYIVTETADERRHVHYTVAEGPVQAELLFELPRGHRVIHTATWPSQRRYTVFSRFGPCGTEEVAYRTFDTKLGSEHRL